MLFGISFVTMYDNYIEFLTKFWFNIITYINSCSIGMRSHLYNIFSWSSRTSYIFIMESPMMKNFFWFFPCILFSLFPILLIKQYFLLMTGFSADDLVCCDILYPPLYFPFCLLCCWNNGQILKVDCFDQYFLLGFISSFNIFCLIWRNLGFQVLDNDLFFIFTRICFWFT